LIKRSKETDTQMPKKLSFEYVKGYISDKGYTLLSTSYTRSNQDLDMKCAVCNKEYKQRFDRFQMGYYHPHCKSILPFGGYKTPTRLKPIECKFCKKEFQPKSSIIQLCSIKCSQNLWRTDEYRENAKKNGEKGGKQSATKQSRRSKNEVYFAELCKQYFTITTNEPFFDKWDADVIIHSDKIAIMWNGQCHYKKISKTQTLKQVQARDKVKTAIIEKYGYASIVIKDMGKYNTAFVDQEFEIFLLMRMATKLE